MSEAVEYFFPNGERAYSDRDCNEWDGVFVGDKLDIRLLKSLLEAEDFDVDLITDIEVLGFIFMPYDILVVVMINNNPRNCYRILCEDCGNNGCENLRSKGIKVIKSKNEKNETKLRKTAVPVYSDITTDTKFKLMKGVEKAFGFTVGQKVRCTRSLVEFNDGDLSVSAEVVGFCLQSGECLLVVMKQNDPQRCFGFGGTMIRNLEVVGAQKVEVAEDLTPVEPVEPLNQPKSKSRVKKQKSRKSKVEKPEDEKPYLGIL